VVAYLGASADWFFNLPSAPDRLLVNRINQRGKTLSGWHNSGERNDPRIWKKTKFSARSQAILRLVLALIRHIATGNRVAGSVGAHGTLIASTKPKVSASPDRRSAGCPTKQVGSEGGEAL
jgi:hypothetical protein